MIGTFKGGIVRTLCVGVLTSSSAVACWNTCCIPAEQDFPVTICNTTEVVEVPCAGNYVAAAADCGTDMDEGYEFVFDSVTVDGASTVMCDGFPVTEDIGYVVTDGEFPVEGTTIPDDGYTALSEGEYFVHDGLSNIENGDVLLSEVGYMQDIEPQLIEYAGYTYQVPFDDCHAVPSQGCIEPPLMNDASVTLLSDVIVGTDTASESSTATEPPVSEPPASESPDDILDDIEAQLDLDDVDEASELEPQEAVDADGLGNV